MRGPDAVLTRRSVEQQSDTREEPELVLSSTATRLERKLAYQESLFERHPITVVSTDFIKSSHRRAEFLRTAPELVIVDEADLISDLDDLMERVGPTIEGGGRMILLSRSNKDAARWPIRR